MSSFRDTVIGAWTATPTQQVQLKEIMQRPSSIINGSALLTELKFTPAELSAIELAVRNATDNYDANTETGRVLKSIAQDFAIIVRELGILPAGDL